MDGEVPSQGVKANPNRATYGLIIRGDKESGEDPSGPGKLSVDPKRDKTAADCVPYSGLHLPLKVPEKERIASGTLTRSIVLGEGSVAGYFAGFGSVCKRDIIPALSMAESRRHAS